jgi:hypothetical protein
MACEANSVEINGVKFVRETPSGKRAVVVVDRGWIFAGDVEDKNGRIVLTRAVHVLRWEGVGFDGMIKEPGSGKVHLKALTSSVDMPADAELFRVPVDAQWGL